MRTGVHRSLLILLLTGFVSERCLAQVLDYTEVVPADSLKQELIFENISDWFSGEPMKGKERWTKLVVDSLDGSFTGDFEFMVYTQRGVLKKPSGSVGFHLVVETKDYKYRYRYSDFIYYYYKENRNYEMIRTGKTKPLAETVAKGWQSAWNSHMKKASTLVREQITRLKAMAIRKKAMVPASAAAT